MARPPLGSLAWAQALHDAGIRVEYWSERWEASFEMAPTGCQVEWLDAHGKPVNWRIRPAYTVEEAMLQAATTQAATNSVRGFVHRLFGKNPPRSQ